MFLMPPEYIESIGNANKLQVYLAINLIALGAIADVVRTKL